MAERKNKDLGPHPHNTDGTVTAHQQRVEYAMPANQFESALRQAKSASRDQVLQLRHATHANLKRLGVPRDTGKAHTGKLPAGSDNTDMRSLILWMERIPGKDHADAVAQLVALDATTVART